MRFPRDPRDRRQRLLDPDPRLPRQRQLDPDPRPHRPREPVPDPGRAGQNRPHLPLPPPRRERAEPELDRAAGRSILAGGRRRSAYALARWERHWLAADGVEALRTVGIFGTVDFCDLAELFHSQRRARDWRRELSYDGLLRSERFRRGGRRIEAVTLTRRGRQLLERSIDPRDDGDEQAQAYSSGPARPQQVLHDTAVYRAARCEFGRISAAGRTVLRVRAEDHLQRLAMRRMKRAQWAGQDLALTRAAVAAELELPLIDSKLRFPDVRIELEPADPPGSHPRYVDLEICTPKYSPSHLAVKAQTGWTIYQMAEDGRVSRLQDLS